MDTNDILALQETLRIKDANRVAAVHAASTACIATESACTAAITTIHAITVNTPYKLSPLISLTPISLAAAVKATSLEEDRLAALAAYEAASKTYMAFYELNKANLSNYDIVKSDTTTCKVDYEAAILAKAAAESAYEVLIKALLALIEATANTSAAEEEAAKAFISLAEAYKALLS